MVFNGLDLGNMKQRVERQEVARKREEYVSKPRRGDISCSSGHKIGVRCGNFAVGMPKINQQTPKIALSGLEGHKKTQRERVGGLTGDEQRAEMRFWEAWNEVIDEGAGLRVHRVVVR